MITKIRQPSRNHVHRIFRSWWFGVFLLLAVIIGLAYYQQTTKDSQSSTGESSNVKESTNTFSSVSYGVVIGAGLDKVGANRQTKPLTKVKNAGFTQVRLSLNWHNVEPVQGKYNWVYLDNMMRAVKKTGLEPILLANTTPTWARREICQKSMYCPPENPEYYAKFVAAGADRYKNYNVAAWEIWNEQNGNNFWKPTPEPERYVALLRAAYVAIKKTDSNATVLIGGLSGDASDTIGPNFADPRTYLTKLYAAGVHGYFDGLAYHPYMPTIGPLTNKVPNNGWIKMNSTNQNIRKIMSANGDTDKGIWITEYGVPTGGSGPVVLDLNNVPDKADHVSLDVQAELAQTVVDSIQKSPWIRSFIWYTDIDDTTAATNTGAAYGIWLKNGQPKPVLKVLQEAIKDARTNSPTAAEAK